MARFRPGIYRARVYTDVVGGVVGERLTIIEVELEFKKEGEIDCSHASNLATSQGFQ